LVNYKPRFLDSIGTIHQHVIQSGEKLIVLHSITPWVVAAQSMEDTSTATDYVVTSGKTFHAVEMVCFAIDAASGSFVLYSGDTADAKTARVGGTKYLTIWNDNHIPLNFTIASGKYLTIDALQLNKIHSIQLVGYET